MRYRRGRCCARKKLVLVIPSRWSLINGKGSTSHEEADEEEEEEEDDDMLGDKGLNIPDTASLLSAESASATASPASSNGGVYSVSNFLLFLYSLSLGNSTVPLKFLYVLHDISIPSCLYVFYLDCASFKHVHTEVDAMLMQGLFFLVILLFTFLMEATLSFEVQHVLCETSVHVSHCVPTCVRGMVKNLPLLRRAGKQWPPPGSMPLCVTTYTATYV